MMPVLALLKAEWMQRPEEKPDALIVKMLGDIRRGVARSLGCKGCYAEVFGGFRIRSTAPAGEGTRSIEEQKRLHHGWSLFVFSGDHSNGCFDHIEGLFGTIAHWNADARA
jgi:hypothetical protein